MNSEKTCDILINITQLQLCFFMCGFCCTLLIFTEEFKMKRTLKKSMSILLALTLLLGSFAFGFSDVDWSEFVIKAEAEETLETFTEGYYTYTVDDEGNATITDCDTAISGNIIIPLAIDGHKVVEIGEDAFFLCKNVSEITIPDGIIRIAKNAFSSCGIEKITIPDSVIEIGYGAFQCNLRLITVTIGNGVVSIGDFAFYMCNNLLNVSFGDNLKSIGENAFVLCEKLKNITIPGNVEQIGSGAFLYCSSLENIIILEGVKTIGYGAFGSCAKLEYVHIPSTVTDFISADYESDTPVTILESSSNAYICSNTKECQANIYSEENDIKFVLCNGHKITEKPDIPEEITSEPIETTKPITVPKETTSATETSTTKPVVTEPLTTKPVVTEPSTTKPAEITEPATTKPTEVPTTKPATTQPVETTKPATEPTTKPVETTKLVVKEEIIKKPSTSEIKYGETLILHADFENIPDGTKIVWSVDGDGVTIEPSADGKTCAVTSTATGDVTITAKYTDANGVEHVSEQEIESNAGLWQKIVSFFKNLFGISRIIEQVIKF